MVGTAPVSIGMVCVWFLVDVEVGDLEVGEAFVAGKEFLQQLPGDHRVEVVGR